MGLGRLLRWPSAPSSALLPLGQSLAVAVEAEGDGQGEDLGGGPERVDDDQAEDDPVVSPTDQGFGAAGDQRVVMHAGAVEGQAALAAEGVVDRPEEGGPRGEDGGDELGEGHGEVIEVPGGVAEEAMEPGPVADADVAAGEDDLGDVAVAMGEDPAGDDQEKVWEVGAVKTGEKCCSRATNEGVSSMSRLP